MNFLTDEQIDKAVNWWAKKIDAPSFDAGDDSFEIIMAETMASMLVKPVTQECITKFKDELRSALKDKEYNPLQGLHTDYHPNLLLFEVAQASGVSENNFPWKTICISGMMVLSKRVLDMAESYTTFNAFANPRYHKH